LQLNEKNTDYIILKSNTTIVYLNNLIFAEKDEPSAFKQALSRNARAKIDNLRLEQGLGDWRQIA
jgi:hypothetical protein